VFCGRPPAQDVSQGRIAETMKKIADVDQLVGEVNAAEKMAAKKAKKGAK
jgi:hypothetical protein